MHTFTIGGYYLVDEIPVCCVDRVEEPYFIAYKFDKVVMQNPTGESIKIADKPKLESIKMALSDYAEYCRVEPLPGCGHPAMVLTWNDVVLYEDGRTKIVKVLFDKETVLLTVRV